MSNNTLKNIAEIADWHGVTARTVHRWIAEGLEVADKAKNKNLLCTKTVQKWLEDRAIRQRLGESEKGAFDRQTEEARLKHHQANLAAISEAEMSASLFSVKEVIALCTALHAVARKNILSIHTKVARRFPDIDTEVIEEIEQLSLTALNELGSDGMPAGLHERVQATVMRLMKCDA